MHAQWGLNEGQLYPQQLQQSAQVGYAEAPSPPLSPEFLLDYLLFDGEQEMDGLVLFPESQVNASIYPSVLPSSSDFCEAPAPSPVHFYEEHYPSLVQGFSGQELQPPAKGTEKPTAQSKAARQRRKRISERTQVLGQHIPGAGRMNTAEMLQAGFKYVKFLQAQTRMLDVAESSSSKGELQEDAAPSQLMEALLAEPSVQEKLAGEELCLVPTKLVKQLSGDRSVLSRPSIARELHRLLR